MAFDIMQLFAPGALNRLLQPQQDAQGVQNFLANPEMAQPQQFDPGRFGGNSRLPAVGMQDLISRLSGPVTADASGQATMGAGQSAQGQMPALAPQAAAPQTAQVDPWAGLREQDVVRPDMMQTGAVQPKAAQPSFMDRYRSFVDSDRGAALNDLFTGWASGNTISESLANGAKLSSVNGRTRKNENQTVNWLKGKGMDEQQAKMLASSPPALNEYLKSLHAQKSQGMMNVPKGGSIYDQGSGRWLTPPTGAGGVDQSEYGLNPQYGVDANGNAVILQLSKDGTSKQTALPNGVTLSKEPIKLDAGTHFVLLDPITRQPIGQIPKNVSGEASDVVRGKAEGEAAANLGQLEDSGRQILSTIDSLSNDPYLDSMVGAVDARLPSFSSDAARVQGKMDQIQGQAFLQAFNSLRGGGQITEIEGKKATDAIAALNTAQSEKDYRNALKTFRGVVETGLSRARSKAGGGSPSGSPAGGDPLSAARSAIERGAPRDAVIERLRQSGVSTEGL